MPKKRVLVTIYNPEKVGGPTVSMNSVMNSYLKDFYEFSVITISEHLGSIPRISVVKRLEKEIIEYKPDVLYISGLQLHGFYMILAARLAKVSDRTVLIVHGSACDNLIMSRIKRYLFRYIIEPYTVKHARITYTVCEEMAKNPIIVNNCSEFGGVIHNAAPDVDYGLYPRDTFRKELGVSDSDVIVVYTGRVVMDKGIQYLLDSLLGLPSGVVAVIAGDGPDLCMFQDYIKSKHIDNCIFLGRRSDVLSILSGSDIFVFPSLHENLPNSILEACVMGLPVIATDVGGNKEIVRDGENGILVPARDSIKIHDAIMHLTSNSMVRHKMGEKSKAIIKNEFTKDVLYPKIHRLFELVCDGCKK